MFNEIGLFSQIWESHSGNDTMEFILHQEIPRGVKATYVQDICNIRPQKTDTHRTRITVWGYLVDYPGEVGTATPALTAVKINVNSVISDIISRYMSMDVKYFYLNNCIFRA